MLKGKFAVALDCIDGRTKEVVINYAKENFGTDFVDFVDAPGMDGILSGDILIPDGFSAPRAVLLKWFRAQVEISAIHHKAKTIIVVGHDQCAGNPVKKEKHSEQIKKAVELVRSWNFGPEVVGIWVGESAEKIV